MLLPVSMDLRDLVRKARKIKRGWCDGQKCQRASGTVRLAPPNFVIKARCRCDGQTHEIEAKRSIVGERATIKIDGEVKAEPDIDIEVRTRRFKVVVVYVLEYQEGNTDREIELRAPISIADLL